MAATSWIKLSFFWTKLVKFEQFPAIGLVISYIFIQLLNDKSMEKKFGMSILNSLQRADGKRNTWKTTGKK